MKRPTHVLSVLALLVVAPGGRADSLNGLRSSVARVGDVNGDGVPDLAVASRDRDRPERVWIVSGKDGARLLEIAGRVAPGQPGPKSKTPGPRFGNAIGPIDDWDHDGTPDFYVSARSRDRGPWSGYRRMISGKSGDVLTEIEDAGAVGGSRDLDRDGRGDLLLVLGPRKMDGSGHIVVVSGSDGSELVSWPIDHPPTARMEPVIESIAWLSDVDGDGGPDFATARTIVLKDEDDGTKRSHSGFVVTSSRTGLTLWSAPLEPHEAGALVVLSDTNADGIEEVLCVLEDQFVRLLDGKKGSLVWERSLRTHVCYSWGSSLDRMGDVDGDGIDDLVIAANESWGDLFDGGLCNVASGKTGETLRSVPGDANFGFDACGLGDVNGDGVPDFAVGAERQRGWTPDDSSEPAVQVRSGKDASILWMRRHVDLRK